MKRFRLSILIILILSNTLSFAQRMTRDATYQLHPLYPITEATQSELMDLETIRTRMIAWFKGSSAPSISAAKNKVIALRSNNNATPINCSDQMKDLGQNWQHTKNAETLALAEELLGFVTQTYKPGYLPGADPHPLKRGYDSRDFWEGVTLVIGDIQSDQIRKDIIGFARYYYYYNMCWSEDWANTQELNSDFVHNSLRGLLGMIALGTKNNNEAVREMKGFKRLLDIANIPTGGTLNWIKEDGCGFHHNSHYNEYMYAYGSYIDVLERLKGTQFQISKEGYNLFRDAVMAIQVMCHENTDHALSLCGRKTFNANSPVSQSRFKSLVYIGGDIYETLADSVLAVQYNRIYGNDAQLMKTYGQAEFPTGLWQFNWSPIAVYRGKEWVATAHGMNSYFFGSEIINDDGIYARYQAYGALEIMYKGGLSGSGFQKTGWDYSLFPGTTTKYLSKSQIDPGNESDERADPSKRFAGALRFKEKHPGYKTMLDGGETGMYGNDFQQYAGLSSKHDGSFKFKKSFFFMDDYIVCLGSNIQCSDVQNKIVTTLFQGALKSSATPIHVNGTNIASNITQTIPATNSMLVDGFGTGYYLLSATGDVSVNRNGTQTNAYINHGTAPDNANFEYVVKPATTATEMTEFGEKLSGSNKPYTVLYQSENIHAIKFQNKVEGYNLFVANSNIEKGSIKANSKPCMIMLQPSNEQLHVTLVNPDLGLTYKMESNPAPITIQATFRGQWEAMELDPGISIASTTDSTTAFTFVTELGEPYDMKLKIKGSDGKPVQVSSIKINGAKDTISINEILELDAEILPENAVNKAVNWHSADANIAKVNSEGSVQGITEGNTFIYVESLDNGIKDSIELTVHGTLQIPVSAIQLSKLSLYLEEGETDTIKAIITPENASDKTILWSSSDDLIVNVNNGIIQAVREGSAVITAKSNSSGLTATCAITVHKQGEMRYIETFENLKLDGFGQETYTGDNGFIWNVDAKGVSGYMSESKEIYFKSGKTGVISGTIPGGIASFSVKCLDKWQVGTERTLHLLINGNKVGEMNHTGEELYNFEVNNINIEGDFTLAIKNATAIDQTTVVFDDISWVPFTANSIEKLSKKSHCQTYPVPFKNQLNIKIDENYFNLLRLVDI